MFIGNREISEHSPTYIIAEIGINHNKDVEIAKRCIDKAKEIGADAVKFQSFIPEKLYSPISCPEGIELLNMFRLTEEMHKDLFSYCQKRDIPFISTPFESDSAKLLNDLGIPAFKIASGEVNYYDFIKEVASYQKPIILSTGAACLGEVEKAHNTILETGNTDIVLLHCVSAYPAIPAMINLKAIKTLKKAFPDSIIGFSDHSAGVEAAIMAVSFGAKVIEKHFTLDKTMEGPDHQISADVEEFQQLIKSVRKAELMMGNGIKKRQDGEGRFTRSLASTRAIPHGHTIQSTDIVALRPGGGIDPEYKRLFVGKTATRGIQKGELLEWDMI